MSQPDDNLRDDLIRDDPELAEFSDLIANLRSAEAVEPESPSPDVWAGIQASLADADSQAAVAPVADLSAARTARSESATRRSSFGSRGAILTAVAAALLLVAVPVGLALRGADGPEPVELAAASLDVLTVAASEPGDAVLFEAEEEGLWLEVNADAQTAGSDFLELWLLRVDADGQPVEIVSLGELDGSENYEVPADLDLNATWLVDVSVEEDDGDDTHGGNSVLRGELI